MTQFYGGQAVIEGVMMRGREQVAVAVRAPNGEIMVHRESLKRSPLRSRVAKWPIVRGTVALWDTLALGMRALVFSASVAEQESNESGQGDDSTMPTGILWGSMAFAILAALGIFFVTPVLVTGVLDRFIESSFVSNLVEKVIRLGMILGYMVLIGLMPDVKRVFGYHGAEHKTINALEAGNPLDVEHTRKASIEHPRCGTTFLIVVVLVSFLVFVLLGWPQLELRIISRIVLLPVIAGLAFELIYFAASNYHRPLIRALLAPGLAVQGLTTAEPDDNMLEVAIVAMKTVLASEAAFRNEEPVTVGSGELAPRQILVADSAEFRVSG